MSVPSVETIRRRVGGSSFERGQRYAREGRIHDPRRQGNFLKARCAGSFDNDYRVEVELNGAKIVAAQCTCPVGEGGYCKHVAALLLSFRAHPEAFQPVEDLDRLLGQRSKDELIELIHALLEADPDLEDLVESAAASGSAAQAEINAQHVERQVAAALQRDGYGLAHDRQIAGVIKGQLSIAVAREKHRTFAAAAAIAEGVLAAIIRHYESISDESGLIAQAATDASDLLCRCFPLLPPDGEPRAAALEALFELLRFDVEFGGIGISDGVPDTLARHATPTERRRIIDLVRESLPTSEQDDPFGSHWRRECWGALIADLSGEDMSVEDYLAHCREFGLTEALIAELLKRKRFDEAREAALEVADYRLPAIADMLVKHRRAGDAEVVMRARASGPRSQASEWLVRFYEEQGRWEESLQQRLEWFKEHPGLEPYREIRRVAKKAGRWTDLKDELLGQIRATGDPQVEIPILLEEKRCDELLQLLDQWRGEKRRIHRETLLQVAQAVEKKHPERALEIYLQQAELAMQRRQRGNYAEACELLRRARDVYKASGRDAEWRACVEGIAAENRRLRAFQDELRRARLLPK